ncbi:hypothetical protein F0562_030743 [Nyssa sinensis]|uniref:Uncharacterized protein n=1 Tax=Nyssa sinensis TaxID=561372 RepID=A0A5J5AXA8_9ASTE|nr:hypothetical protein F0562_030743 [Nyssa sinensis]
MAMDQAQSKTGELQAAETGGVVADQTKAAEGVSGAKKLHGHGFKSKLKAFLRRAAYAALCGYLEYEHTL